MSKSSIEVRKAFGEWVKTKREALGISQAGASRRADIDRQQWYRIEAGKSGTRRDTVINIARAISVDADVALQMAGYAPATLTGPPTTKAELLAAIERLGVSHIEFEDDIEDSTPEELEQILDAVRVAVEVTLSRQKKK